MSLGQFPSGSVLNQEAAGAGKSSERAHRRLRQAFPVKKFKKTRKILGAMYSGFPVRAGQRNIFSAPPVSSFLLTVFFLAVAAPLFAQSRDGEIVANLAGGRVIVHAAREAILFAAVNQPVEPDSIPPRVVDLDLTHIGVLLGAAEWRVPLDPTPIRIDRNIPRAGGKDLRHESAPGDAERDLETIGIAFLEKLRPLVAQLHHKLEFSPDDPVFELIIIGYAPADYGPEVWVVEYRMEQEQVATRGEEYWQTRLLRPRFTQLYPPEKHAPHTLVETRYPPGLKGPTLAELIQGNDPRITPLGAREPRFEKVLGNLRAGTAQKAAPADSADFMRAVLPLISGNASFVLGQLDERRGLDWIVPPSEPVEKVQEDKNRPPEAPTLRRKPNP